MAISVPSLQRRLPISLLDPMAVAVYLIWAVIVAGPLLDLAQSAAWSLRAAAGVSAQLLFLALFLLRGLTFGDRVPLAAQRAIMLAMAGAALVACWAFRDGIQPTLIVIMVPGLPALFRWRGLLAVLAVVNGILAAVLFDSEGTSVAGRFVLPLQLYVTYLCFQAFALLAIVSVRQANDARDQAQRTNAELLATRRLLEEGTRAEERLRLARDLHDVAGHKLTALKMQLALHRQGHDSPELATCQRLADELLADVRGVVGALRQHEGIDLAQALRALDPHLPAFTVSFEIDADARVADMRAAEALLRCAQEGLTNAMRHGSATAVRVRLLRDGAAITLSIEDDGVGRVSALRAGNGLRGLQERLRELGGTVDWSDLAPRGLQLKASLSAGP